MTTYHFSNGFLAEVEQDRMITYGPWGPDFACRETSKMTGAYPRLALPDRPLLDESGLSARMDAAEGEECRRYVTGRWAVHTYLAAIPLRVRRLAAACGPDEWLALDAMNAVPDFADFLEREVMCIGTSFVRACWGLSGSHRPDSTMRPLYARWMMTLPRHEVLSRVTGVTVHPAVPRLLRKMDPADISMPGLAFLHARIGTGKGLVMLGRAPAITRSVLLFGADLPDWLLTRGALMCLAGVPANRGVFETVFSRVILNASGRDRRRIRQALARARSPEEARGILDDVVHRILIEQPFPEPPTPGSESLIPLRSFKDLERESRAMNHCIQTYATQVIAGEVYAYAWKGDERATVLLAFDERGCWYVDDVQGYGNADLTQETMSAIYDEATRIIGPKAFRLTFYVAGTRHNWGALVEDELADGVPLELVREPNNANDPNAVAIYAPDGPRIGYVPKEMNAELARRMDTGRPMDCTIEDWGFSLEDTWVVVTEADDVEHQDRAA